MFVVFQQTLITVIICHSLYGVTVVIMLAFNIEVS